MASFYYPRGPFGPVCDTILPDDDADRVVRLDDDDDDGGRGRPIDGGPRPAPVGVEPWPQPVVRCKTRTLDDGTIEYYDCFTDFDAEFDDGGFNGVDCIKDINGECFDWKTVSTGTFGLSDDFFVPLLCPISCVPYDTDINIKPVEFLSRNNQNEVVVQQKYACEKSSPVTYGVNAIVGTVANLSGGGTSTVSLWNDEADKYAVWTNPAQCTLPCIPQEVTYRIFFKATDTYYFEFGADDTGELYFDSETVPFATATTPAMLNDSWPQAGDPTIVAKEITAGIHLLTARVTNAPAASQNELIGYVSSDNTLGDIGTISPGPGTAIRDKLDGFADTSGQGLNEVGGFDVPSDSPTGQYLSFGTINPTTTPVSTRTASITMDLTEAVYITFTIIAGSDNNGGERPNDVSDTMEIDIGNGWIELAPSKQSADMSFDEYDRTYGNWYKFTVAIPENLRLPNATIQLRSGGDVPEIGGSYNGLSSSAFAAAYANCADVFGLYKVGIVTQTPGNCNTSCDTTTYEVIPLYRYYNPTSSWSFAGDHFSDSKAPADSGYYLEGQQGFLYVNKAPGTRAVVDNNDLDFSSATGVPYSGIIGYAYFSEDDIPFGVNTTPMYAMSNGSDTMWSTDPSSENPNGGHTLLQQDPIFYMPNGELTTLAGVADYDSWNWSKNPGGWYIKCCKGSPCVKSESLSWVRSGPVDPWSDLMNNYAVWPNTTQAFAGQVQSLSYSIFIEKDATLNLEYSGDNTIDIYWDGTLVAQQTNVNGYTSSATTTITTTKGDHTLKMDVWNEPNSAGDDSWSNNPAGGAWVLSYQDNVSVTFDSGGGLVVTGTGTAEIGLSLEWDDNPNTYGTALGTYSVGGVSLTQTPGVERGAVTASLSVTAGQSYPASIANNTGGFKRQRGNTELCFKDGHGDDCNAILKITNVAGGIIRTSADLTQNADNNLYWHTRMATGYTYTLNQNCNTVYTP